MNLSILNKLKSTNKRKFFVIALLSATVLLFPMQSRAEAFPIEVSEVEQSIKNIPKTAKYFLNKAEIALKEFFGMENNSEGSQSDENTQAEPKLPDVSDKEIQFLLDNGYKALREKHPELPEDRAELDVYSYETGRTKEDGQPDRMILIRSQSSENPEKVVTVSLSIDDFQSTVLEGSLFGTEDEKRKIEEIYLKYLYGDHDEKVIVAEMNRHFEPSDMDIAIVSVLGGLFIGSLVVISRDTIVPVIATLPVITKKFLKTTKKQKINDLTDEKLYNKAIQNRKTNKLKPPNEPNYIDEETFYRLTRKFRKHGGIIIRGEDAKAAIGKNSHASYMAGENIAFFREKPTVADVLEEMHHAWQDRINRFGNIKLGKYEEIMLKREIETQKFLLRNAEKYKLSEFEIYETKENLKNYEMILKNME